MGLNGIRFQNSWGMNYPLVWIKASNLDQLGLGNGYEAGMAKDFQVK